MSWSNWFNWDNSSRANRQGVNDALAGRKRDVRKALNWLAMLSERNRETSVDGYNSGYDRGLIIKAELSASNRLQNRRSSAMNIEPGDSSTHFHLDSLDTLDELAAKLRTYREQVEQSTAELFNYVNSLAGENRWNDQAHAYYCENHMSEIKQLVERVIDLTETETEKFIRDIRAKAEELGLGR